jgi:hypothetical protein
LKGEFKHSGEDANEAFDQWAQVLRREGTSGAAPFEVLEEEEAQSWEIVLQRMIAQAIMKKYYLWSSSCEAKLR